MSHLDLQPTLPSFSELIGSIPLSPSLRRCVADESHMPPSPRHAGPQGFERPYDDRKWGMLCKLATALCREELEDQSLYALLFKDPLPSPALVNHAPPNRSDIDVVLERLEDLINHPDPDISTVVRCVSEMLDNSVAPPYAQGWYKPMAKGNEYGTRLEQEILRLDRDGLVQEFFFEMDSENLMASESLMLER